MDESQRGKRKPSRSPSAQRPYPKSNMRKNPSAGLNNVSSENAAHQAGRSTKHHSRSDRNRDQRRAEDRLVEDFKSSTRFTHKNQQIAVNLFHLGQIPRRNNSARPPSRPTTDIFEDQKSIYHVPRSEHGHSRLQDYDKRSDYPLPVDQRPYISYQSGFGSHNHQGVRKGFQATSDVNSTPLGKRAESQATPQLVVADPERVGTSKIVDVFKSDNVILLSSDDEEVKENRPNKVSKPDNITRSNAVEQNTVAQSKYDALVSKFEDAEARCQQLNEEKGKVENKVNEVEEEKRALNKKYKGACVLLGKADVKGAELKGEIVVLQNECSQLRGDPTSQSGTPTHVGTSDALSKQDAKTLRETKLDNIRLRSHVAQLQAQLTEARESASEHQDRVQQLASEVSQMGDIISASPEAGVNQNVVRERNLLAQALTIIRQESRFDRHTKKMVLDVSEIDNIKVLDTIVGYRVDWKPALTTQPVPQEKQAGGKQAAAQEKSKGQKKKKSSLKRAVVKDEEQDQDELEMDDPNDGDYQGEKFTDIAGGVKARQRNTRQMR